MLPEECIIELISLESDSEMGAAITTALASALFCTCSQCTTAQSTAVLSSLPHQCTIQLTALEKSMSSQKSNGNWSKGVLMLATAITR